LLQLLNTELRIPPTNYRLEERKLGDLSSS